MGQNISHAKYFSLGKVKRNLKWWFWISIVGLLVSIIFRTISIFLPIELWGRTCVAQNHQETHQETGGAQAAVENSDI